MTGTARRSTLGWAFVAVLALALGGLALALADQGVNRARTDTHHDIPSAADELPIPSGAIFGAREQLAADSSAGGGPDLWSFTRVGPAVRVQHWIVTPSVRLVAARLAVHLSASWPPIRRRRLLARGFARACTGRRAERLHRHTGSACCPAIRHDCARPHACLAPKDR